MAKNCNTTVMAKPSGNNSSRMNPNSFARNNMSKGGCNQMIPKGKSDCGTGKRK